MFLQLPAITPLPVASNTSPLALLEEMSTVFDGPAEAVLGNVDDTGTPVHKMWADSVSENPNPGDTEVWEFYNFTADAHPMHIHEIAFEVVNRERLVVEDEERVVPLELTGDVRPPEAWESGFKDTVIAYPGEVTRVRAHFVTPGQLCGIATL
jgi:FtsP/CotA-like multicopper oxidase with cupredoxin domain